MHAWPQAVFKIVCYDVAAADFGGVVCLHCIYQATFVVYHTRLVPLHYITSEQVRCGGLALAMTLPDLKNQRYAQQL